MIRKGVMMRLCLSLLMGLIFQYHALAAEDLKKTCNHGDCENGYGKATYQSKETGESVYKGDFRNGLHHGYGEYRSQYRNAYYDGRWQDGKKHGRGSYIDDSGHKYTGNWKDDKRHGQGEYYFNVPDWRYNSRGKSYWKEKCEYYQGEFKNDHYHGRGTYYWPNGSRYEGKFAYSNKHGDGRFYYKSGQFIAQEWEYGKLKRIE